MIKAFALATALAVFGGVGQAAAAAPPSAPLTAGDGGQVAPGASGAGWSSLSSAEQGVISAALGRDDAGLRVRSGGGVPTAVNPRHGFSARFGPSGVRVESGGQRWDLGLREVGRGDRLEPVADAVPVVEDNRVSYRRGPVGEWYANGPAGLQQGFTLDARPAGNGPLTLALGEPGAFSGQLDPDGRGAVLSRGETELAYRGLQVWDATGRELPASLDLAAGRVQVEVHDQDAQYPVSVDPFVQAAQLIASDGDRDDLFGSSVAVSGDTVVVGAPGHDVGTNPIKSSQGAAYVFVKPTGPAGTLFESAKLVASDGDPGDLFGSSVAVSGDTVVVGAPEADGAQGAAYVFVKPGGGWSGTLPHSAKLLASDGDPGDKFGASVAVSGDTVVVGACAADVGSKTDQGSAYVFVEPSTGWSGTPVPRAKLLASDGAAFDFFGDSVAVSGDTVVVGAPGADVGANVNQGSAYVFVEPRTGWSGTPAPRAKLRSSDGTAGDFFGSAVGVSGDTVVVGAPFDGVGTNAEQGSAYVFVEPHAGWSGTPNHVAKLLASDGATADLFGSDVAASGETVVVGAPFDDVGVSINQGSAYVFVEPDAGWSGTPNHVAKLLASDGASENRFGNSVAASGGTVVVGAPFANVGANDSQGSAYVFEAFGARGPAGPAGPAGPPGAQGAADSGAGAPGAGSGPPCGAVTTHPMC